MSQKMNPVNWFEIPSTDFKRAINFYSKVFSYELKESEMGHMKLATFPSDMAALGATGAIISGPNAEPCTKGSTVYFYVSDIEQTLSRINENGGKTLMPKTSIGEWGFIAQFLDSEGNRVALHAMT